MNILVTGGAGFIGTHLTRRLTDLGHKISILDNFLPQVHSGRTDLVEAFRTPVRLIRGDIADPKAVEQALDSVEAVVHLAAETGTGQSMYEVERYSRTNLHGTALLFDRIVKDPGRIRRIVSASSRAIYGEGGYRCDSDGDVYPKSRQSFEKRKGIFDPACPICGGILESAPTSESAPPQPTSFYGLTKLTQERMTVLFGEVLEIPSVALRFQNVFGPGQSLQNPYTGILAIFSNLARTGKTIRVFEDGMESRDFVYIEDVVEATVRALFEPLVGSHVLNIGSGVSTSVLSVAQAINAYYGSQSEVRITGEFRDGDIRHGFADLSAVRRALQFEPQWSFSLGLEQFLNWASRFSPAGQNYEQSLLEMQQRGLLHG